MSEGNCIESLEASSYCCRNVIIFGLSVSNKYLLSVAIVFAQHSPSTAR